MGTELDGQDKGPPTPAEAEGAAPREGMPDWLRFPLVLGIVGAVSAAALAGAYSLTKGEIEKSEGRKVEQAFKSILGERYSSAANKVDAEGCAYYALKDGAGETVAYAAQVSCLGSYNTVEPVQIMVAVDPGLERVLGVRVVKSAETPGMGERIKEPPSPLSIAGWVLGRERKKRVALKGSGALVGYVTEKEDGSVEFTGPDGRARTIAKDEVLNVTDAPFPPAFLDQFTRRTFDEARLRAAGGGVDAMTGATVTSRAVTGGVKEAVRLLREAAEGSSR